MTDPEDGYERYYGRRTQDEREALTEGYAGDIEELS